MIEVRTPAHHTTDEYYTPQSLATKWGCSKDIVYDLLRTGKLQGFKLGRDWRISDAARLAYERDPEHCEATQYNIRGRTAQSSPYRVI